MKEKENKNMPNETHPNSVSSGQSNWEEVASQYPTMHPAIQPVVAERLEQYGIEIPTNEGVPADLRQAETQTRSVFEEFPWEMEDAPHEAQAVVLNMYETLTKEEKREPLPDDHIKISGGLDPGDTEWDSLIALGIDESSVRTGHLTRKELQDAGYFFINVLGGGEKRLIHTAIPDPESEGGQFDFSNRKLLTRAEVEKVYQYQQEQGDGLQGENIDQVRADALLFLRAAVEVGPFKDNADLIGACIPESVYSDKWTVGDPVERELAIATWEESVTSLEEEGFSRNEAIEIAQTDGLIRDILIPDYRKQYRIYENLGNEKTAAGYSHPARNGSTVYTVPHRYRKLNGYNSPFLESGFVFYSNPDIAILNSDKTVQRFNMVNIHLMGGHPDFPGLSEMGQADWDQRYMSTGDFVKNICGSGQENDSETMRAQRLIDLYAADPETWRADIIMQGQTNWIRYAKLKAAGAVA